ncbi:MAG TPA: diacylglycerol kinase family protein [Polyangiaceae bacterium]
MDLKAVNPGDGFAILVNANAKRGGRRIAAQLAREFPRANLRLTKSIGEIESWLASLKDPKCVLAAGGDGTSIALLNAMQRFYPADRPFPTIGLLPLGTGNAWARTSGASKLGFAVRSLKRLDSDAIPTRRFGLVEVEGGLTSFVGTGWDAQVLNDYKNQLEQARGLGKPVAKSVYGYLTAMLFRTAPKTLLFGRPHLLIENLGDEVYTLTPAGRVVPLEGAKHGTVLYDGPMSVAGAATCPEYGYGFRAYPFAERFLGLINARVYDREALPAIKDIPKIWRGQHPLKGMRDWFTSAVRMTFSRPTPLQIGGDAVGERISIDYKVAKRQVEVVDFRALST